MMKTTSAGAMQRLLIVAMAFWGMNFAFVKLLTHYFEPMVMASVRMVVACLALTAFMAWRRTRWPSLTSKQIGGLLICAATMVYGNQILFSEGMLRSTATNGALIMALAPLVSAVMAALAFGERLTANRLWGVALGFFGVAAVVLSHPGATFSTGSAGDLLVIASVIAFAGGGLLVQRLARQLDVLWISWMIYAIGTVMLVMHTAVGSSRITVDVLFPGYVAWGIVLLSAVLSSAAGNVIWNQAIGTIGLARTAIFLYWVPVFGVAFAALLIGEALTWWHFFGFVLVMTGTWIGTRPAPGSNVVVAPVASTL